MTTKVYAFMSFGLGGAALDPAGGEARLIGRLKAIGVDTVASPYDWSDIQTIVDRCVALPKDAKLAVGGDSLGDNEALQIAHMLNGRRDIDLLFGFQRSEYGVQFNVPANVIKAVEIYNPVWLETLGLGDDPWVLAPGNRRTVLRNIPIEATHPDDFGIAQDIVFAYIKRLASA